MPMGLTEVNLLHDLVGHNSFYVLFHGLQFRKRKEKQGEKGKWKIGTLI